MTRIALFHSVLGVRRGITDAEARLTEAGHDVTVVDQYGGRSFDDYGTASTFAADIGFPELMTRALNGVDSLPDGFVAIGFSNGGGMASFVATRRAVRAVVLCSGALPLDRIGVDRWPAGVPAQLHASIGDPFARPESAPSVMRSVAEAGAIAEYLQYPGHGHLFTDADLTDEYDASTTERFWTHVLRFLRELDD